MKAAEAILAALAAEKTPLRLALGSDAVDAVLGNLDGARQEAEAWAAVGRGTDYPAGS